MPERIGIIGDGGQADETESFLTDSVLFRAVERGYLNERACVDVEHPGVKGDCPVVVAVGTPGLRKRLVETWRGNNFSKVISERAYIDSSANIAEGVIIAPGAIITTNVKIGRHALVNVGASIQHDSIVGEYVTVGPGVKIAGNVTIGDGAFIGIGATIIQRVSIETGVVVGAGSTVTTDLTVRNGVYVGIPARLIRKNDGWLDEL